MTLNAEDVLHFSRTARVRDSLEISKLLNFRGITSLYHFTRYGNLQSIRMNGLRSRSRLEGIGFHFSDSQRLDQIEFASSLSVSLPNIFMLKQKMASTKSRDFIVLEYDARLLMDLDFLAFPGNASSARVLEYRNRNIQDCVGVKSLERLFLNDEIRYRQGLHSSVTTDPQSEIMILREVPWKKYVKRIYFHDHFSKQAIAQIQVMREAGYVPATKNATSLEPQIFLEPFHSYSPENQERYDTKFSEDWLNY